MPFGEVFTGTLVAARAGAEWAWVALYREFAPAVVGYFRARGAPEPDDLAGEVFLQLVRDLHRFEGGEGEFRAWLFSIAHHRMVDDRRHRARRPVAPVAPEVIEEGGPSGDSETDALAELTAWRVRKLIGRLSPDQQIVLLLRLFGDLSLDDVARIVGKSVGAVKAIQRRGLAALRRHISTERVSR
jgi:RNA polymerase sigma factor (sigma-70 family)